MARFSYDLDSFQFYVGERCAWGITSALAALGRYPAGEEARRQVGKAVHTAVELYVAHGVEPHQHTAHTGACLEQFLRYLDRERAEPVAVEVFAYARVDDVPFVAITDLIVSTPARTLRIVELKTGPDKYPNNLQTAAQQMTLNSLQLYEVSERQVVSLYADHYERAWHRHGERDRAEVRGLFRKLGPRPQTLPDGGALRVS